MSSLIADKSLPIAVHSPRSTAPESSQMYMVTTLQEYIVVTFAIHVNLYIIQ